MVPERERGTAIRPCCTSDKRNPSGDGWIMLGAPPPIFRSNTLGQKLAEAKVGREKRKGPEETMEWGGSPGAAPSLQLKLF